MSRFDLRDISDRLSASPNTNTAVFEFIRCLEEARTDWCASVAFYEVSADALVNVCERDDTRLIRREIMTPLNRLPSNLVQTLFHPIASRNAGERRGAKTASGPVPFYLADPADATKLMPLTVSTEWQACACVPLIDQEDIIALLILVSDKKNAFPSKAIAEIAPVRNLVTIALAQHLYRTQYWSGSHATPEPDTNHSQPEAESGANAVIEFEEHLRELNERSTKLAEDNRTKEVEIDTLAAEAEKLDQDVNAFQSEIQRAKGTLDALEEQTTAAIEYLTEAYSRFTETEWQLGELERTLGFMRELFERLGKEHVPGELPQELMEWLSEHFGIERCSLMLPDANHETLWIAAQCGIDPEITRRVRVRIGQGIAGWVARHRRPLLVQVREEAAALSPPREGAYNSDSFIAVPLIHNDRLYGVLNLSNKRDGEPFNPIDLDRALLASSILALTLEAHEASLRSAA